MKDNDAGTGQAKILSMLTGSIKTVVAQTGANFVTPYYLDTWRSENRLVS